MLGLPRMALHSLPAGGVGVEIGVLEAFEVKEETSRVLRAKVEEVTGRVEERIELITG
jgi:hypothetical protein